MAALTQDPITSLLDETETVAGKGSLFHFTSDHTSLSGVLAFAIASRIYLNDGILGQGHRPTAKEPAEADILGRCQDLERLSFAVNSSAEPKS